MTMRQRLRDMKNLGQRSEEWLSRVSIRAPDDLRRADPYQVYAQLKATVPGISLNALYALIGAIESRHWQEIKKTRRMEILLRLDDMGLAPARTLRR